jgi:hypothetical protein
VLALATTRQSAKRRVVGLSSCHPVANDARQTACSRAACCHIVARFKSKDWLISQETGRRRAARQRAVWRALLETGRQDDSATTRHLAKNR